MIYDCFLFFNEADLLEIRLNELNSVVDKFIIVEGNLTHSGEKKELFFKKCTEKIKLFKNKIIYLPVDLSHVPDIRHTSGYSITDYIEKNPMAWSREIYQRNYILNGLKDTNPDDLVMISDIDEIPNKNKIKEIKNINLIYGFEQNFYYYYLNCINTNEKWIGTKATYYKNLKTPQELRMSINYKKIINGGWHFSYLGGIEQINKKIKSFSHQEYNTQYITDLKRIKFNIKNNLDIFDRPVKYKTININSNFPEYILNNIDKLSPYIKKHNTNQNTDELIEEIYNNRKEIDEINKVVSNYRTENQNLNKQIKEVNKVVSSYQSENQNLSKHIEEVNQKISIHQKNLNVLTSSKYYKIWRLYCKLKDLIKK